MKYRIADLFCGAGGTSAGAVEAVAALGRQPEVTAVNHWPVAIETHTANHPDARHLCTGIDSVNPRDLFREDELDLLWASPECTHHSVARGGKPINDQSRATAWCVVRWAEALRPPIILIENVPEFETWGPIGSNGRPLASKKGQTFSAWLAALESLGYKTDYRLLCAADYGDPTTRTRLFVQAVRGRRKIIWPEATHSKNPDLLASRRWTPAREIIDWSLPAGSIFERKKPLSPKTLARIEAGLRKFGLRDFIVAWDHTSGGPGAGVASSEDPLSTVVTKARHGLAAPFLVELRGGGQRDHTAKSLSDPCGVVTANGNHHAIVQPFLVKTANGSSGSEESRIKSLDDTAPTICGNRGDLALMFGLVRPIVEIDGNRYLLDIRFRMLQPHELALAQGFPRGYRFTGTKTDQVKQIGNAVPRRLARALVAAVLSQNADVSHLVDAEEARSEKEAAA